MQPVVQLLGSSLRLVPAVVVKESFICRTTNDNHPHSVTREAQTTPELTSDTFDSQGTGTCQPCQLQRIALVEESIRRNVSRRMCKRCYSESHGDSALVTERKVLIVYNYGIVIL